MSLDAAKIWLGLAFGDSSEWLDDISHQDWVDGLFNPVAPPNSISALAVINDDSGSPGPAIVLSGSALCGAVLWTGYTGVFSGNGTLTVRSDNADVSDVFQGYTQVSNNFLGAIHLIGTSLKRITLDGGVNQAGGTFDCQYTDITNCPATGGAVFTYDDTCTIDGSSPGWNTSPPPTPSRSVMVSLPFSGVVFMNPFTYNFDFTFVLAGQQRTYLNGGGAKILLFKNNVMPVPTSQLSDFEECDYGGYVAKNFSLGPIFAGGAGVPTAVNSGQFDSTPNGTTNVAYGMLLTNTIDGLVAGTKFQTPVNLGLLHQSLPFNIEFTPAGITMDPIV